MHPTFSTAAVLALSLTWMGSALAGGNSTSPGRNAVFVSATHLSLPPGGGAAQLLTAQIKKGKKNTVIAFEVMAGLFGDPLVPLHLEIYPDVNGVVDTDCVPTSGECDLGPVTFARMSCPPLSTGVFTCNVVGTAWFDVDAAERAHPGMFVNQPLSIVLKGMESTGHGVSSFKATLTARVVKK